ncbi:hypothetical protein ATANTOWER_007290 [Ataeniobius toweri]|uniref:Uncharacterized protein n=1 Tax=Ataeniobius toweri TaxID=208326 RepID=A0ABU7AYS9_9TELE|nr:hypothetical protein [Ataeniobius toweri]
MGSRGGGVSSGTQMSHEEQERRVRKMDGRKYSWISASVFFVSLLCTFKPPVGRGRWPLTLSLVLLEVSSC